MSIEIHSIYLIFMYLTTNSKETKTKQKRKKKNLDSNRNKKKSALIMSWRVEIQIENKLFQHQAERDKSIEKKRNWS